MISSIILIIFGKLGIVNPDLSLGFWKWYTIGMLIELTILFLVLKWIDKKDLETDYGRNKTNKRNLQQ